MKTLSEFSVPTLRTVRFITFPTASWDRERHFMTDLLFIDYPIDQGLSEDDAWVDNTYTHENDAWDSLLSYIAKRVRVCSVELPILIAWVVKRNFTDPTVDEKIKGLVSSVYKNDDDDVLFSLLRDETIPIKKVWVDAYFSLANKQDSWYAEYHMA
jgi:hypothetical protein